VVKISIGTPFKPSSRALSSRIKIANLPLGWSRRDLLTCLCLNASIPIDGLHIVDADEHMNATDRAIIRSSNVKPLESIMKISRLTPYRLRENKLRISWDKDKVNK
jgi:hypothetical protein